MKYVDEYRQSEAAEKSAEMIRRSTTRPWTIMEICGGQTNTIVKYGIESLLPPELTLVHGPGCPVCVTPLEIIDKAIAIASRRDVIFTSFGDMLRVPGSSKDLLTVKAEGGNVRMVYSPLDAVRIAGENPEMNVVFFGVGFETTAPANRVQGFLAAGHVCTVMGYEEYFPLAERYRVPLVVTGFEPLDVLQGIYMTVRQLEEGRCEVENQYTRSVRREGNVPAQKLIREVFCVSDRAWRGIGVIPMSGYALRDEYAEHDAEKIFDVGEIRVQESPLCIAGVILQGLKKPGECPAFGAQCTPEHPLGAPMVSSEGACAAYYHFGRYTGGRRP